jgi:sugar phosphate isomerase/epimerase
MIRVAVITSCMDAPLKEVLPLLESIGVDSFDLYCYHPSDIDALNQFKGPKALIGAALVKQQSPKLVGITTNLPDLSSNDRKRRNEARRRLIEIIRFASNPGHPHDPIKSIQIRAGRRIESERIPTVGGPKYQFRLVSSASFRNLVNSLKYICDKTPDCETGMALEIEPGLPYLLNDEAAVRCLASLLEKRRQKGELWPSRIGLNLDIGHAFVNGWSSQHLLDMSRDCKLPIMHCHISDHSRQHFADLAIGEQHLPAGRFRMWIEKYVEHLQSSNVSPLNTLSVSLELEANGNLGEICQSYWTVHRLIRAVLGD